MHGYLLLTFDPEAVRVRIPRNAARKGGLTSEDLRELNVVIEQGRLDGFHAATDTESPGNMQVVDGKLVGHVAALIDVTDETFTAEARFASVKPVSVKLVYWVSNQNNDGYLTNGIWHSEDKTVHALIYNDPSADDACRAHIAILGPDIESVRKILFAILRGSIRIKEPFIV